MRNNPWIPYEPHPKQARFLRDVNSVEALYGGAARGGKSDALLMAALQYITIPNYSAIIFRKTITDLMQPDGLMPRSAEWMSWAHEGFGEEIAHFAGDTHTWHWPWGASLQFGYIGRDMALGISKYRYQGARYQFIGWDELTQNSDEDYAYLFSRLDRPNCEKHRPQGVGEWREDCAGCQAARPLAQVPLRVRAATNPGGIGHMWVRDHFQIERDDATREWVGRNPDAPFYSARVEDNLSVDQKAYNESLERITDIVTRKQLKEGDWGIAVEGRFKEEWVRKYEMKLLDRFGQWDDAGKYLWIDDTPDRLRTLDQLTVVVNGYDTPIGRCRVFMTVDPAASEREGPGDTLRYRKDPSNTVISTWLLDPKMNLLWLDCQAGNWEVPEGVQQLRKACRKWRPEFVGIEANGSNIGFYQYAVRAGMPVRQMMPGSNDKIVRSGDASIRMEQGKILFPRTAPWLKATMNEVFAWTGHKQQQCDRVDTLSYAALVITEESYSEAGVIDAADFGVVR